MTCTLACNNCIPQVNGSMPMILLNSLTTHNKHITSSHRPKPVVTLFVHTNCILVVRQCCAGQLYGMLVIQKECVSVAIVLKVLKDGTLLFFKLHFKTCYVE